MVTDRVGGFPVGDVLPWACLDGVAERCGGEGCGCFAGPARNAGVCFAQVDLSVRSHCPLWEPAEQGLGAVVLLLAHTGWSVVGCVALESCAVDGYFSGLTRRIITLVLPVLVVWGASLSRFGQSLSFGPLALTFWPKGFLVPCSLGCSEIISLFLPLELVRCSIS